MSQTKIEISNLSDSVIAALAVPKITSITYPGDDTAANPTGGQEIILTGSGFSTGAIVNIAGVPVAVSSVVNGNTIAFNSPAKATGSYSLSVINTDGGIAVFIANMEYSGVPAWSTPAGTLGTLYETDSINAQLTAVSDSAVTYAVTSGLLPGGTSLNSATGALTGTTSSVASSTTYSFTVDAVDAEQQNTSRNFSATINPDVVSWSSPADGVSYSNTVGDIFTQALSATSAAGKMISYSANALPSGLSISGANISGTFSAATTSASLITATAASTNKTATRTLNWSIVSAVTAPSSVEYLVVAGGGGGGGAGQGRGASGGGGAGGYLSSNLAVSTSSTVTITVGAGGLAGTRVAGPSAPYETRGGNGANSVIAGTSTITAIGGGGGGVLTGGPTDPSRDGQNGGSGGGGGWVGQSPGGLGTAGQGNNGRTTTASSPTRYAGGGGGGAGAAGGTVEQQTGGAGLYSSISGANTAYAGGGGGGGALLDAGSNPGAGGVGGGGAGGGTNSTAGTINTGGGGGGAVGWNAGDQGVGGAGGSGIVILRYADTYEAATSTTGSPTITTAGGYRVYKWTSSGSITF